MLLVEKAQPSTHAVWVLVSAVADCLDKLGCGGEGPMPSWLVKLSGRMWLESGFLQ